MVSTVSTADATNYIIIGNLQSGSTFYFRVRAKNSNGDSDWSEVKSTAIGTRPAPPTTWSSTDVVIAGEKVNVYWVHNSEDNSNQTSARINIDIYVAGEPLTGATHTISGSTSSFQIDTSEYPTGAEIYWIVSTAGVTGEMSNNSVTRTIKVVGKPYMSIEVRNKYDNTLDQLDSYPFYVTAMTGPPAQHPIGYSVSIIAETDYETTDRIGNIVNVRAGDAVYSKYFSGPGDLSVCLSANDVSLENYRSYKVRCVAAMDSGLTVEAEYPFFVIWDMTGTFQTPNAEIVFDEDIFATHIRPYCNETYYRFHKVLQDSGTYTVTTDVITSVYGEPVANAKTTTGEQVYYGVTGNGEQVYYCTVRTSTVVEDISLAVYRREFDGSFTEIATDIENGTHTFVTDPHPSLDYARYRVVATHKSMGAVTYYDVPPYHIGGKAIIIQWDESWTDFAIDNGNVSAKPAWAGSMLKLMANVDVSDQYNTDASFVSYIGRKHPVGYYGTQVGETSSWSTVIPKDDKETLYALRRLAVWMGNAYVREPSGSGYWANVKVSFSQKHRDVTIPVSLDITRVEGGL
jgi:hypothetical protein